MSSKRKRGRKRERPAQAPPASPAKRYFLLVAAAALLLAGLYALDRRNDAPLNLVLISIDTLRADHLSSYGSSDVSTPHIDRLAEEGVLFERVQSVAPTTLPAHASLFTGQSPLRHDVHDNIGFYLSESIPTLASHLNEAGYRTGGFVGAFVLDSRFGIARGFDTYYDDFEAEPETVADGFVVQRRGEEVLERAIEWMEKAAEPSPKPKPFFTFLHFYDPHTPYDPPAPFQPAEDSDTARYRGEVAYADSLVGQFLSWLSRRELDETTVVALVSDHGEALGSHGERTHGFFLYEAALRVPWIVRYPGAPRGTRVSGLARIIDVAPTLIDLLSLAPLSGIDGESLRVLIDDPQQASELAAYAETFVPRLSYGWSELRSLRRGSHKLILAPRSELYDVEQDPGEVHDLKEEQPELYEQLRSELDALMAGAEGGVVAQPMDAETLERLHALGYVGGGAPASRERESGPRADPKDRLDLYQALNDPALASVDPEDRAELEGALSVLQVLAHDEPPIPRALTLYGELLLKAERASEAETVFERMIEPNPSFTALYGLAVVELAQGKMDEAEEHFLRAMRLEPKNTKSYVRLAKLSRRRGDVGEAEAWLRKGIEIHPDRLLKEELADVLLHGGRPSEALDVLAALAEENESDALAFYNLAQALLATGDNEGAMENLRAAIRLAPEDADVHQALGNALIESGEHGAAVLEFQRAVEISPCFVGALGNMGSALVQLGRLDEAASSFERALSCEPDYAPAYRNLGSLYLQQGKLDAAEDALQEAVRLSPEDRELKSVLEELVARHPR